MLPGTLRERLVAAKNRHSVKKPWGGSFMTQLQSSELIEGVNMALALSSPELVQAPFARLIAALIRGDVEIFDRVIEPGLAMNTKIALGAAKSLLEGAGADATIIEAAIDRLERLMLEDEIIETYASRT
jgi:hypothetical protein